MKYLSFNKTFLIILVFTSLLIELSAQDKDAAYYFNEGIKAFESSNYDKAIEFFKEGAKLAPEAPEYPYEIALSYFSMKNTKAAISILDTLKKRSDAFPKIFILLSNCYQMQNDNNAAYLELANGLSRFPTHPDLYVEMGILFMNNEKSYKALQYWHEGTKIEPNFDENYYYISLVSKLTKNNIIANLYSEQYCLISENHEKVIAIYKMKYDLDTAYINYFMKKMYIEKPNAGYKDSIIKSMLGMRFEYKHINLLALAISEEIKNPNKYGIDELVRIRRRYVQSIIDNGYVEEHNLEMFRFFNKMIRDGVFDSYSYLIYGLSDNKKGEDWAKANQNDYQKLIKWLTDNKLVLDKSNNMSFLLDYYFETSSETREQSPAEE